MTPILTRGDSDIGGRVSSDNHDVYEDGLFIPLVKLYDGDLLSMNPWRGWRRMFGRVM